MPTITPIAGPAAVQSSTSPSNSQMEARARAIAALQGNSQAAAPVENPNQVSVEEMAAVKAPENTTESGQSDTSDAQDAPAVATQPEPKEKLSAQYAQLARKEKQIRAQVNAIKAQEAAIKAREDAIKAKEAEYQSQYIPKDRIAKDPLKVLQEQGYTADQITQMLLNAPDPVAMQQQAVIDELRAEIATLKDGQESVKKTFQENQTQAYQQALNQIRTDVKQLVTNDSSFEAIKATNSVDDVVELIEKTFQKDGHLLTVEEAAQAVEEYLVEEAYKLAKLNKIQAKFKPAEQKPAPTQQQTQKRPTLTNAVGTSRQLTARERAVLAFKGELK